MQGKINAFYGAELVANNGVKIGELANGIQVEIVEPFGKPAYRTGEWVKVRKGEAAGWVKSEQVNAPA